MTDKPAQPREADELAKADPVGYSHRLAAAKDLDVEAEKYKLFNGLVDYDARNPVHASMSNFPNAWSKAPQKRH